MACGGMIFIEKFSNFRKKKAFHFILFHLVFLCCVCYYCSINIKRQSELSGFRPDTSSLVLIKKQLAIFSPQESHQLVSSLPTKQNFIGNLQPVA